MPRSLTRHLSPRLILAAALSLAALTAAAPAMASPMNQQQQTSRKISSAMSAPGR